MSDKRPLLFLPTIQVDGERDALRKFPQDKETYHPGRKRQGERLTPKLTALHRELEAETIKVANESSGHPPEKVLVLEAATNLHELYRAVSKVDGLDWLAEPLIFEIEKSEDFNRRIKTTGEILDDSIPGFAYLLFSSLEGMEELLGLWRKWQDDGTVAHGLGRFKQVFEHLVDLRYWSVRDRMRDTKVIEQWAFTLEHIDNNKYFPCEIELWFRPKAEDRATAEKRVRAHVERFNGRVVDCSEIAEIRYHALLAQFPTESIDTAIRTWRADPEQVEIADCDAIQFLHPVVQAGFPVPPTENARSFDKVSCPPSRAESEFDSEAPPRIAIFDGLPLQNHQALRNRLIIDDPEDIARHYRTNQRVHATSMASLVLWGDLGERTPTPLKSPVYVRPILRPGNPNFEGETEETLPEDKLVVDTIFHAVARLYASDDEQPGVAPEVSVINLSIGIRNRAFVRSLSPLARLLDWLAWRYKVLFVVSAGNYGDRVDLPPDDGSTPRSEALFGTIAENLEKRRLFAPAESINAITVGSINSDALNDDPYPRNIVELIPRGAPSPLNALGMGFNRSIKPDVFAAGGRVGADRHQLEWMSKFEQVRTSRFLGVIAATPGPDASDLARLSRSHGTSNATALVTRSTAQILDMLKNLDTVEQRRVVDRVHPSLWAKCLVVHSAGREAVETFFEPKVQSVLGYDSRNKKRERSRFVGYGAIDNERVLSSTNRRVTALGSGMLAEDEQIDFYFPVPVSLSGKAGIKEITCTLAWYSPVNFEDPRWRKARLFFKPANDLLTFGSRNEAEFYRRDSDSKAVLNGTVQHEVYRSQRALVLPGDDWLRIRVNCASHANGLDVAVPFALAVTMEVSDDLGIDIYDDIARILEKPPARQVSLKLPQRQ